MAGQMPQGHYAGNRAMFNAQSQQPNYNMNRISSPHQGMTPSDEMSAHNQGKLFKYLISFVLHSVIIFLGNKSSLHFSTLIAHCIFKIIKVTQSFVI